MDILQDDFEWFLPEEKSPFALSIPNRETINFNPKLLPLLPPRVVIGVKDRGRALCICAHEKGFALCKNGSVKRHVTQVIQRIVEMGVRLPARYTVTEENGHWIARLETQAPPVLRAKRSKRNPREKDIAGLLWEVEKL